MVSAFYWYFFTVFDPFMCLFGVYANLFNPAFVLQSYTQKYTFPPNAETTVALDGMAGFFAGAAFLQLVLLRLRPDDLAVWKSVQVFMWFVDAFMLGGLARAINTTKPEMLTGQDYGNLTGYALFVLIRTAFLLNIGVKKSDGIARKRV